MAPAKRKRSTENKNAKRPRLLADTSNNLADESFEVDSQIQEKTEAEVGIIEHIQLKNFMCHSSLDFKFGPNVNFIVGRNGSGKSAVLTGIVVGLGGKASTTSRGTTIKSFIKNGKKSAEVCITLRNCGSDAYKPKEYGNKIKVVRQLNADGQSLYKLISTEGKVICTKREELNHILDQFNIQVDNPVSILNQEVSRNFLHSKSPHDKYKFFLKATQLEQMDRDYNATDHDRRLAKEIMESKQKALPQIENEVSNWEKKYKLVESMDKLRDRLDEVKNEAVWAQVNELQNDYEQQTIVYDKDEKRRPKYLSKVEEAKNKLKKAKKEMNETQSKLTFISSSLDMLNPQKESRKEQLENEKQLLRKSQTAYYQKNTEIKAMESDKQNLQKRIEDIRNSTVQRDINDERQKRLQEIATKTEKQEEFKAQIITTSHHCKQINSAVIKYQGDIEMNNERLRQIRIDVDKKTTELKNFQGCKIDQFQKFGNWVPELLRKIDLAYSKSQFKRKPFGPIGAYVNLRDSKWALAIESHFGRTLRSFLADNYDDHRLLEKIMKETIRERRPDITVTKYTDRVHDIRRNRAVSDRYPTIYDMLDIKEVVVINFLIDRCNIENIMLIENNEEAREVMSKAPPRKCNRCYTVAGDRLFPHPGYRYYAAKKGKRAQFLQSSVDELIRNVQEDISVLEQQKIEITNTIRNIKKELEENQKELRLNESRYKTLQNTVNKLQTSIMELNNIDDPEPVDVTTLEQEINHIEDTLQVEYVEHEKLKQLVTEKKQTVTELEELMTELNKRIQNILTSKSEPLTQVLNQNQQAVVYAEEEKRHYENLLEGHDKKLEDLRNKLVDLKNHIKASETKALRVCPRVETERDPEVIDNEIEQINIQLKSDEKSRGGSKEEITKKFYDAKKKFLTVKKSIDDFKLLIDSLSDLLNNRRENYAHFRRAIAHRVNYWFIISLRQRNYNGKLEFDHKRELLSIKAQPLQNVGEMNEDMRALSGGERSFSTISFILAMWDAMEAPFRILDEFDVFMDMVTRRVSLNMLLESAVSKTSCQYCFLTPLEISAHNDKFDLRRIKTFKMPDPDRNQRAVGVSQRSTWEDEENENANENSEN